MTRYKSPGAFRHALTDRIKKRAKERGVLFNRYRQLVLFDRFLSRVYSACGEAVILKGGYLMELRLGRARTTSDVDMGGSGNIDVLIGSIIEEAGKAGEDQLSFEMVGEEEDLQEMVGEQIVYEGRRAKFQAHIGGVPYGDPFGLDLSIGDALVLPPDSLRGDDLFEFVGVEPLQHRVYPKAAHVAEKLHAISYEFEDGRVNGRAKDLVDVGLLAANFEFDAKKLIDSIAATFSFRNTHPVPTVVPDPPTGWDRLYEKMRETDDLKWQDVEELHEMVSAFLNPVLAHGGNPGRWHHESLEWSDDFTTPQPAQSPADERFAKK